MVFKRQLFDKSEAFRYSLRWEIRPHLDYDDIAFDQPTNDAFCKKLESVQYNAAPAITEAIKGTSQVKPYKELGLESLKLRRKLRRLCTFYKIKTTGLPS